MSRIQSHKLARPWQEGARAETSWRTMDNSMVSTPKPETTEMKRDVKHGETKKHW